MQKCSCSGFDCFHGPGWFCGWSGRAWVKDWYCVLLFLCLFGEEEHNLANFSFHGFGTE